MAIKDEIYKIQTEKNYLRAAIQEKGVFVNDEPFALYPVRISEITDTPGECDDELRTLIEKKMTSYTVPSYVDTIGSFVFYNCVNLKSITIPDSVTYIGHSSFRGCTSLTSIDIPSSVTTIGNQAFRNCTSLTNVTIGSGVTEIQMYAFYGCSSLGSITVNAETPPTLDTRAFDNTNDCPIYVQEDSVEAYRTAWSQYADRIQELASTRKGRVHYKDGTTADIPLSGNSILYANELNSLFVKGNPIVGLEVSNQCTKIAESRNSDGGGGYGFWMYAPELSWVRASSNVKTLGERVFDSCKHITSLDDIQLPGVTTYPSYAFQSCFGLTDANIPEGIQTVNNYCFYNCQRLSSLHIPSTLTAFNDYIHKEYSTTTYAPLTSITVDPNNTTFSSVGNCLIQLVNGVYRLVLGCSTSVIPTDLSNLYIMPNAFANNVQGNCDYTVPTNVATIGSNAFGYACSVTMLSSTPCALVGSAFGNAFPIYLPSGSLETYLANSSWAVYKDRLFERGVAKWTEQSYTCEVDETDTKTGMVTVVEKDTNPTSSTYNQTRTRTYEDLTRCNPSGNTFSKITQLADATTGKYIVVYDNGDGTGIALKASLIKNTSSATNGINANNNFIDVSISDGYVSLSNEDTSTTAIDYDGNYISWTDPDTEKAYRLCGRYNGAAFEYSSPNHEVRPESTTYGFSFRDYDIGRHIALFTNSTSGAQRFRWENSSSEKNSVGIYKLN